MKVSPTKSKTVHQIHWLQLTVLFIGGGIIYIIPYLRSIYYTPFQHALGVDNTQLGVIQSVFGLSSILCYFPGGWLADRFSARKLLTLSYIATGLAGWWLSGFPSYEVTLFLYAAFGVTTTLTFWAALIKATRQTGGEKAQGRAFGFLESGRRIVSTLLSLGSVVIFARYAVESAGLGAVIKGFSICYFVIAVITWFILTDAHPAGETIGPMDLKKMAMILKIKTIWFISAIVFLSYTIYRFADFLTPYLTNMGGVSPSMGAVLGTLKQYGLGPFGALGAGFLADRISASKALVYLLMACFLCNLLYVLIPGNPHVVLFIVINMVVFMTAVFAMRGIYFALLEEGHVPMAVTGMATGIVSTLGFLPDVFSPVLGGWFLDRFPGDAGYQCNFILTVLASLLGIMMLLVFRKHTEREFP